MDREEECSFVRLLPNGGLVVRIRGVEQSVEIHGIDIPDPPPALYVEMMVQRIPQLGKPLKCIVHSVHPVGRIHARILCFGWHDKSGDVWVDVASVLLKEGLARVAVGEFPQRKEYLDCEREARSSGKGLWSDSGS